MHGDEEKWVVDAIQKNWVSTVGKNIDEVEKQIAEYVGCKYAVGLSDTATESSSLSAQDAAISEDSAAIAEPDTDATAGDPA